MALKRCRRTQSADTSEIGSMLVPECVIGTVAKKKKKKKNSKINTQQLT